jgi:hypothetical protein
MRNLLHALTVKTMPQFEGLGPIEWELRLLKSTLDINLNGERFPFS